MDKVIFSFKNLSAFLHASETIDLKLEIEGARNFWGYLIGIIREGEVHVTEVMLNQPDWLSEDFVMQQAIIEDLLYSSGRKEFVIGGLRSHHKQGLIPSPEDMLNISGLQSANPKVIFIIFDLAEFKSLAQLGLKAFRLVDPSMPDSGIREIPVQIPDVDEKFLSSILMKLYASTYSGESVSQQGIEQLFNKAKDAIELENYPEAEVFYKKILQDAQQRNDIKQQLEIEVKLLNIMSRDQKYGRVQRQAEKIRAKALEKSQLKIVAQCYLVEGKALTYLGNRPEALNALEKAMFQFQNLSDHIALAQVQILVALIYIGEGNRNRALDYLFKAVGTFRNILDEEVRQGYSRTFLLEENAKNLIRTFPEKALQEKYIKMLNDLSEFRGYKVTLDEL